MAWRVTVGVDAIAVLTPRWGKYAMGCCCRAGIAWAANRGRGSATGVPDRPDGTAAVMPTRSDGLARGLLLACPGGDVLQQGLADLIYPWFHLSGLPDEGDAGHALAGLVA